MRISYVRFVITKCVVLGVGFFGHAFLPIKVDPS